MSCMGRARERTQLLHPKGICSLDKGVGRILVLFLSATKETESAAGALQRFLGLLCGAGEAIVSQ